MPVPLRYLQVILELENDDHKSVMFEQYMRQIMPAFTDKPWPGWELFLSAKRQPDRDLSNIPDEPNRKSFLHIWRVKDYNTLPYLMEYFDDDESYRNLNGMVIDETQELAGSLIYNPQTQNFGYQPPQDTAYYMSMTMDVIGDPFPLNDFRTFMIDCTNSPDSPMLSEYGWRYVYGTYTQTGLLRRYTHIWSTRNRMPDPEGAVAWLMEQPSVRPALNEMKPLNPRWQLWEPVDYSQEY